MVVLLHLIILLVQYSISSGNLIIANGEDNYSSVSNVAINIYQGTNITKWTSSFDND
jgi:hypothetical protein